MAQTRLSLVVMIFGLFLPIILTGCDSGGDGGGDGSAEPANPAFNGTFSGSLTATQEGQTVTETVTVTLTVSSPLSGTVTSDSGQTGTIAGEATGNMATLTSAFNGDCPGSAEGTASLIDDNTLSIESSGSDCGGPFTTTGTLNRVTGG